jgi:hypothetical protein
MFPVTIDFSGISSGFCGNHFPFSGLITIMETLERFQKSHEIPATQHDVGIFMILKVVSQNFCSTGSLHPMTLQGH